MTMDASDHTGDHPQANLAAIARHDALMARTDVVLAAVRNELDRAFAKHPPTSPGWNPHCGYAVILEEVDELWDLVKTDEARGEKAMVEAVQISAMAVRYILECVFKVNG